MGWEWEFRLRAPRQQHDGGLMMCDIFNSFPPHNHRFAFPSNQRGSIFAPPPRTEAEPRGALHYSAAAESRARRRGDRHRRARLIFTGPPGGGLLFAAASRRTRRSTRTAHAPLLAPTNPLPPSVAAFCSHTHPPLPPTSPNPARQRRPRCGTSAQSCSDSRPRKKKGHRDSPPAGGEVEAGENPLTSTKPPGRQT